MSGFQVAPNPAPNPAGFANAASSIYNALSEEAARQQQQRQVQKRQDLKDAFETEIKLRGNKKYVPYDNTDASGRPTLSRRDLPEGQQLVDRRDVVTDPHGRQWVPVDDKPAATPQQTYQDTNALLAAGARPIAPDGTVPQHTDAPRFRMDEQGNMTDTGMFGVNAAPENPALVETPPGSKTSFLRPTSDEKAAQTLRQQLNAAAAKPEPTRMESATGPDGKPAWMQIGEHSGTAKPVQFPAGYAPGLTAAQEETNRRAKERQQEIDARSGERRDDINARFRERAAEKADARATAVENRQQTARDTAQRQIDVYQGQEQQLHGLRSEWGTLMADADQRAAAANGKSITVIDPETKREVPWNEARRKYYTTKIEAAGNKVQQLQETQKKLISRHGGDTGQTAQPPAAPAQATKTATIDHVRTYAQQKGISEAAAVREFKQSGYTIGQ